MNDWLRLKLITAATADVVSLAEAKAALGISGNAQDAPLQLAIGAAVALIEGPYGIGICLAPQTWQLSLDSFDDDITIPLGPVKSISSISYRDTNGITQTVSTWLADLDASPARLQPAAGGYWPATQDVPGAVKIQFVAGYDTIPAGLKYATLLAMKTVWRLGSSEQAGLLRRETVDGVGTQEFVSAELAGAVFDDTISRFLEPYRVGRFA